MITEFRQYRCPDFWLITFCFCLTGLFPEFRPASLLQWFFPLVRDFLQAGCLPVSMFMAYYMYDKAGKDDPANVTENRKM